MKAALGEDSHGSLLPPRGIKHQAERYSDQQMRKKYACADSE